MPICEVRTTCPIHQGLSDRANNTLDKTLSLLGIDKMDPDDREVRVVTGDKNRITIGFTVGGEQYPGCGNFDPERSTMQELVQQIVSIWADNEINWEIALEAWNGTEFRLTEGEKRDLETVFDELVGLDEIMVNVVVSQNLIDSLGQPNCEDNELWWWEKINLGINTEGLTIEVAEIADTHLAVEINDPDKRLPRELVIFLADEMTRRVQTRLDKDQVGTVWVRPGGPEKYGPTEN